MDTTALDLSIRARLDVADAVWTGTAEVRCRPDEADHPWLVRATVPTDTAIELQRRGAEAVGVVVAGRVVAGMVASGRLHQPGPSTVDIFGQGECPAHARAAGDAVQSTDA